MDERDEIIMSGVVRTPLGKFGGCFSGLNEPEPRAVAVRASLERAGADSNGVEKSIMENTMPAGVVPGAVRRVACLADIPDLTPARIMNMACGSPLRAILGGSESIAARDRELPRSPRRGCWRSASAA